MTFDPNNLVFFYLILAIIGLGFAIIVHADITRKKDKGSGKGNKHN